MTTLDSSAVFTALKDPADRERVCICGPLPSKRGHTQRCTEHARVIDALLVARSEISVDIERFVGKPDTCRVWRSGVKIFDGVSLVAMMSIPLPSEAEGERPPPTRISCNLSNRTRSGLVCSWMVSAEREVEVGESVVVVDPRGPERPAEVVEIWPSGQIRLRLEEDDE